MVSIKSNQVASELLQPAVSFFSSIIIIILYTTFRNHGKKVACYFILRAELMGALKDVLLTMNKKFNYSLRGIMTMCVEYE